MNNTFKEIMQYKTISALNGLRNPSKYELLTSNNKNINLISAYHGSFQAMQQIRDNVESILDNSNDWLFLIEGSDKTNELGISCDEVGYACLLAKNNDISIYDPIINPFEKEVINKALEKGLYLSQVYGSIMDAFNETIFDPITVISFMSNKYEISQRSLFELYNMMPNMPEGLLDEGFESLSSISNELSKSKLENLIENNSEKSRLLIYLGKAHLPIVDNLR